MLKTDATWDANEFERTQEELLEEMHDKIHDIADQIFAISQIDVPVDKSTLKKSGSVVHGRTYSLIGYNTPYAQPVHDGYDKHQQIVREHDRDLQGVVIRVRSHERTMPQRTGRPYLDNAINKVLKSLEKNVRDSIEVVRIERGV